MKTILLLIFSGLWLSTAEASIQHGIASWYSIKTNRGTKTASGKKLSDNSFTAAHKSLPFGTVVKVTNLKNNKSTECIITDRGPYKKGRVIDVTTSVAKHLGFYKSGLTKVKVEVVNKSK